MEPGDSLSLSSPVSPLFHTGDCSLPHLGTRCDYPFWKSECSSRRGLQMPRSLTGARWGPGRHTVSVTGLTLEAPDLPRRTDLFLSQMLRKMGDGEKLWKETRVPASPHPGSPMQAGPTAEDSCSESETGSRHSSQLTAPCSHLPRHGGRGASDRSRRQDPALLGVGRTVSEQGRPFPWRAAACHHYPPINLDKCVAFPAGWSRQTAGVDCNDIKPHLSGAKT